MSPFPQKPEVVAEDAYLYLCSPGELEESYVRCRSLGVPPDLAKPQRILPQTALAPLLRACSFLVSLVDQVITPHCYAGHQKDYIYILCNPELVALKIFGAPEVLLAAEEAGVKPGTVFTEESCGTNALALAREHRRLRAIRGEQHYCAFFKDWWCVAAPVRHPSGKILGYLDISMHAEKELGLTVSLLKMVLAAVEKDFLLQDLFCHHQSGVVSLIPSLPGAAEQELTAREREILQLVLLGLTSEEVAERLCLSVETIKTHRRNIYRKLGVGNSREFLRKIRNCPFKPDIPI